MAKTQAVSTRSPVGIAVQSPITVEDALAAIQQQNWVSFRRPRTHLSLATGPATGGTQVHTLQLLFASSAVGYQRKLYFALKFNPDVVNITVGMRCVFAGTDTGRIRVTINGTAVVRNFALADNGLERRDTLAVATVGSGWLEVTVELERLTGTTLAYLRNFRISDQSVTASLPDPLND